jgi:hypothetical protein
VKGKKTFKECFITGFIAGAFALTFIKKKSRYLWALFLITRAFDIFYNSLVNKGVIPKNQVFYILLFCTLWLLPGYAYNFEPGTLAPSLRNFSLMMANET